MTKETMTVHKALAELKILDDRIEKAIDDSVFCLANKHSNEKVKGIAVVDYVEIMKGHYNKVTDLTRRKEALKRAVCLSNAVTKVDISGKEFTVVEAIEMKNHGMYFKQLLLDTMKNQYRKAQAEILKQNGKELEERAESYVVGIYGGKEGNVSVDYFEKAKSQFIKNNTYELVDPINILEKIETLEKEIAEFTAEVDAALSVSNAITQIEIEY